jgi:hypothetical protein
MAMRLVAVTRVLNEDDILEAFVRHHAGLVDSFIFLDNGSTDRSLAILQALRAEGVPLTVLQTQAAHFCERPVLTALFRMAAGTGADWVLMLDADEFVDERLAEGGLRAQLAAMPPEQGVLALNTAAYFQTPDDDPAELVVPRRLRRRQPELQENPKVIVRGSLAGRNAGIGPGNHSVHQDGQTLPAPVAASLALAHFSRRSPWQVVAKAVTGRLKVIAAGEGKAAIKMSYHYTPVFEMIRSNPAVLLRNADFIAGELPPGGLVDDPIDYRGGELRYTLPGDPAMKAIAVLAAFGEALAVQHARLIDSNEGVRLQAHNIALTWAQLG